MTFPRFKQLWDALITDRARTLRPDPIIDHGTPITNAELIKVSEGKPSALDHILPPLLRERNIGYGVLFHFTPEQRAFLARHDIGCSDGYIGMLRAYCGNRTVWQTSAMVPILGAMSQGGGGPAVDWEALNTDNRRQLHEWVNGLMAMTDEQVRERLDVRVSLLS